jgi:hypothetical protein
LFEQPSDIWGFKTRYGDKSDSLPAGSPREVIDLLNPPDEFKLWNNLRALCEATEAMTPIGNTREFTDTHRKILYVSGVRPVIPIYEL